MIDKMADSYLNAMHPLTIELFGSSPPVLSPLTDDDDKSFSQDYFLSDDHWKKFEIDFPELSTVDDIFKELNSDNSLENLLNIYDKDGVFLNHHDCMWAGHCGSKEHSEEPRSSLGYLIPKPPVIKSEQPSCSVAKAGNSGQQQSLLKPSVKANSITSIISPSGDSTSLIQHALPTPPESDDEENKCNNTLWKILNDAINECDLDEDSDLCEYFKDKDVEVKEEPLDIKDEPLDVKTEDETESEQEDMSYQEYQQYRIRTQLAAENDHSYHKDMNAAMRLNNYGLDTPSESEEEEEIDVVSVNDKFGSNSTRIALSLPNNPSSTDRHNLQRRMATAMSRKHDSGSGIKTLAPTVRCTTTTTVVGGTTARSGRGTKRGRGSRTNAGYKRRRFNVDGSVREPTDKRHLHNDMERQRRVDLRIAFENLKAVVPEVSGTKKIAKVNILLQAAQYCYYLTGTNANYTKQHDELRKRQVWLRQRVSQLRRNLAARR